MGRVGKAGLEEAGNVGCVEGNKPASAVLHMKATVTVGARMLSKVFVIIGDLKRWGECICAKRIREKGVSGAGHVAAATAVANIAC